MTTASPIIQQESTNPNLRRQLFENAGLNAYAVLDGASNPALLDHLYDDSERPEFGCLYRGELEPDMAECAPYLVRLEQGSKFTEWLIENCYGNHWGIFATGRDDIQAMLRHFRKLNMVYDEERNGPLLFRFYDPRVLRKFMHVCDEEQASDIFGTLQTYFAETGQDDGYLRFDRSPVV